jgi:hypothetical protein
LAIVGPVGFEEQRRAQPLAELNDEQKQEWLAIVNRMPADWFPRESHACLAQYCRHVVAARRVAQLIAVTEADSENFSVAEYDRLLKMQEREGRALSALATRMRLTQQSRYESRKTAPEKSSARPWAVARGPEHSVD